MPRSIIGRFVPQSHLGKGSYGDVWSAFDRERGAEVALKLLRRREPRALRRFKEEFRLLAGLHHRNLVGLHELVVTERRAMLVMELIDGVDFIKYVRQTAESDITSDGTAASADDFDLQVGKTWHAEIGHAETLDVESCHSETTHLGPVARPANAPTSIGAIVSRLVPCARQLATGLAELHHAGVLHCDLKHSNVLVTKSGRVVILDLGLANRTDHPWHEVGEVFGTPAYMSPEQARGEDLTEASDWYSVGALLYTSLFNRLPILGSPMQILAAKRHLTANPVVPRLQGLPSALRDLCVGLLDRDPSRRPAGAWVVDTLADVLDDARPAQPPSTGQASATGQFLGRADTICQLAAAFDSLDRGPRLVHVHGPPGIGKTAAIEQFLARLPTQTIIIRGRCHSSALVPFLAVDEVIDRLSDEILRRRLEVPDTVEQAALETLFPILRRHRRAPAPSSVARPADAPVRRRRQAAVGFRELLRSIAAIHPTVVFIDDVHFGDRDSAELLTSLFRLESSAPILLVVCQPTSADDADRLPHRLLTVAARLSVLTEVAIGPLDDESVRTVVSDVVGDNSSDAEAWIAQAAAGSPFVARELARSVVHRRSPNGAPSCIEEALTERINSLTPPARSLVNIVAIAGSPIEDRLAYRAANLAGDSFAALAELHREGLVRGVAGAMTNDRLLDVSHDRFRRAIVGDLSQSERASAHQRIAGELLALGSNDAPRLAHHLARAGEKKQAARFAVEAAEAADAGYAFERAAELYALAIDLVAPSVDRRSRQRVVALTRAQARCLAYAGRCRESASAFASAARRARGIERLRLRHNAAEQLLGGGFMAEGLALSRSVRSELGIATPATAARALPTMLIHRAKLLFRPEPRWRRTDSNARLALAADVSWSHACGLALVDPLRAVAEYGQSALLVRALGDSMRAARLYCGDAIYSGLAGGKNPERSARLVDRAVLLATASGDPEVLNLALACRGIVAVQEGNFRDGERLCREALAKLENSRSLNLSWERATVHHFLCFALYYRGAISELRRWVPERLKDAEARGDVNTATDLRTAYANLVVLLGAGPETALAEAGEAVASWPAEGFYAQHYYALVARVQVHLYRGDAEQALREVMLGMPGWIRSFVGIAQGMRIDAWELAARVFLLAASQASQPRRAVIVSGAKFFARLLRRERADWATALGALRGASVCAVTGDDERAIHGLTEAISLLDAQGMDLHAACARLRLADLGADGRARSAANAYFRREQLQPTTELLRVIAPGFPHR